MKKPHPTRIFKTPEELFNAWKEYKEHKNSEGRKWVKVQYVGKDAERVEDIPPMPYNEKGFFVWYKEKYDKYIHQYFDGTYDFGDEFLGIVTHIKADRDDNIITGSLLGFFNANMGNRITGLTENVQNTIIEQPLFPDE
jgi:hypothetical protein